MVDIISRKSGPRREDVDAKRVINKNWPTISRLADQISNGGYSRSRKTLAEAKKSPAPLQSNLHIVGGSSKTLTPEPMVRVSMNNRVIVMDVRSGKQLDYLGAIRFQGNQKYFALATSANDFFATVDEETEQKLADLDGVVIESDEIQLKFIEVIKNRLDI
ncbi:hypothetical protein [Granulosicoccus antarcticus]|uniref:Uncharacterized protein n=1 Tax=Granulosicoccus antarcticus IMCC3135 TaxID=1192854 RepID=A0A2Z2NY31_9GAMM|nr:hypothetical protein [Granulosicoccus antarcticus]ASJ74861.1 hypothetical protein IMCC3135_23960 [Granulosicoccus antarcticus IMCC3135]